MENLETLIDLALEEDLSSRGDVTSLALIDPEKVASIYMVSRTHGVFVGTDVIKAVTNKVDPNLQCSELISDGDLISQGQKIAELNGNLQSILKTERTVLNFVQHLSGVATATRECVNLLEKIGSATKVRDTRKTLPGYRALEKYAVAAGGGVNHRMGLYDAFLVKDNHLAGSDISEVVKKCRTFNPDLPLEVEVDNIEQLKIVLKNAAPDLILLDNFSVEDIQIAQKLSGDIPLEVSGGVTLNNLEEYGSTNVTYIAIGSITHSAMALDIGFDYGK